MKRLILVRHAKTEPLSDVGTDFNRALKKRGYKDSELVANDLKMKGYIPDVIISSPATRALQTATKFADIFSIKESNIRQADFIYHGDTVSGMLSGIASLAQDADTVMVVGHNPDIAMLSIQLTRDDLYHFPTTASTVIDFSISDWNEMIDVIGRLEYFVYPKELKEKEKK